MASRRAPALILVAALSSLGLASFFGNGAGAQGQPTFRASFVVLPEAEAQRLFATRPFALGLGVFPESRNGVRFIEEIGRTSPSRAGSSEEGPSFAEVQRSAGVQAMAAGALEGEIGDVVEGVFEPGFRAELGARRVLHVYSVLRADDVMRLLPTTSETIVVVGLAERTPLRVGVCPPPCSPSAGRSRGVLTGSITRRPGLVTPYDIGATLLDRLGVDPIPEAVAGEPLRSKAQGDPSAKIDSLAARLKRDATYAPGLAAVTVSLGVLSTFIAFGLMRRGRREAALRVAQGGVFVLPGWVLATFVPSGSWAVRALVVLAGVILGASLRLRRPLWTLARIGLVSALAFGLLVALAPLNPGAEPGLSIWANPLRSWRFFGLANVPAAIIASGIVVWGVILGLSLPVLVALSAAGAVVTGAPAIGANFVGVLTFVFGAAAVTIALARRRARLRDVVIAGVIGVAAFVLALLADAGSPVSHGGRAARKISDGGPSAAWDLIEGRLRLNWELIRDFGGGVLWVIGLAISLAMLIRWGMRTEGGPLRGRVAILGGALMGFASLVLEDSGFYSGAVLWFVAADAWLLITLAAPGSGVMPPESDAPLSGVGSGTKPPQPGAARRPRSSPD
jgi:hypothetical protein